MSLLQIRDLFAQNNSFLAGQILDVDGETIDPALLIFDTSRQYAINPQVLLAKLQSENGAIKRSSRPSDIQLRTIMGCGGSGTLQTAIRVQIDCAAQALRTHFDAQQLPDGRTVSGWRVGETKQTQNILSTAANPREGLPVIPATKAVAALYTYTPYRGRIWGGVAGGNSLFVEVFRRTLKLYALYPNMSDHEIYDENENVIHRFLTHDSKTGIYTFN